MRHAGFTFADLDKKMLMYALLSNNRGKVSKGDFPFSVKPSQVHGNGLFATEFLTSYKRVVKLNCLLRTSTITVRVMMEHFVGSR
jgi:hypothetical protein